MVVEKENINWMIKALELEEKNKENPGYLGWEWHEVAAHPVFLNNMVVRGLVKITYKSNSSTHYMLTDRNEIRNMLQELPESQERQEMSVVQIPNDIFDIIELHQDKKDVLMRSLVSEKPVHVLLLGSVGSAKSLFLMQLNTLPTAEFVLGSSLTRAGIIDLMFEKHPRYLIVDEIDKVNDQNNTTALLSLMETGILTETKYRRRRQEKFTTWVFAGANYEDRIPVELRSRFFILRFHEYTPDEYIQVGMNVLTKREGVKEDLAEHIVNKLLREVGTRDIRDVVKIARLCKTKEEVNMLISIMQKQTQ